MSFEPKILGFLCNWCSYAGADLAGVSRIQYPPSVRVIRVMCSGRVDPMFVFEAFKRGIDGVIILGCHPGDCHYISGNYEAEMKFYSIKELLKFINFQDRIDLNWVSAAEGLRFAELISNFTEKIKKLGPSPVKKADHDSNLLMNINAMEKASEASRLRAFIGRKRKITSEGNVYEEKIPLEEFELIQKQAIIDEFYRHKILLLLNKHPMSVVSIAEEINIDSSDVLEHIITLQSRGLITMEKVEEIIPFYTPTMEGRI